MADLNNYMIIKEIINPERSEEDGVIIEADIIVTDGKHELLCYFYMLGLKYDFGGNIATDASWENAAYLAADLLPIPIPRCYCHNNKGHR
jgi:hypothetical protein